MACDSVCPYKAVEGCLRIVFCSWLMASWHILLLTIHLPCLCSEGSELCSQVGTHPAISAETAFGFHPAGQGGTQGAFLERHLQTWASVDEASKAGQCFEGAALWFLPFLSSSSWRWPEQRPVPGETIRSLVPVAEPASQPAKWGPAFAPAAQSDGGVPGEESSLSPKSL